VIGTSSVQVQLKGTLRFLEHGFNLAVGSANFTMRRNVTWYYNSTSRTFTADVVVTGEVDVTQWPVPVSGAAKPVTCVMAGKVALESKVYPGECSADLLCSHTTTCHAALGAMWLCAHVMELRAAAGAGLSAEGWLYVSTCSVWAAHSPVL
jgi:hypothetical protein